MKKKYVSYLALFLVICIFLSGCNKGGEDVDTNVTEEPASSQTNEPAITDENNTETETPGDNYSETPESTPSGTDGIITEGTGGTPVPGNSASTQRTGTPTKTPVRTTSNPTKTPTKTAAIKTPTPRTPTPTKTLTPNPNNNVNKYVGYTQVTSISSGMSWPSGQALPVFSTYSSKIKVIDVTSGRLSSDEKITFAAFQGLVNKNKTEIMIYERDRTTQWNSALGISTEDHSSRSARYALVNTYKSNVKGIVVYSTSRSAHYRNAASTIANIYGYLPVSSTVRNSLTNAGVTFSNDNVIDITGWTQYTALSIYQRIYDEYWQYCTKRLLISQPPDDSGKLTQSRDIAAATGAAVLYLDCKEYKKEERALYQKFMKDMADSPDTAIVLGWFTTERSGITAGSEYGISTIPADFFNSASTFSGGDHKIDIPEVPKRPALQNKVYIGIYITDGDNIQYVQGAMKTNWDNARSYRGKVAVNWTIAPGLVDIGPAILNYYYGQASAYECFVAGPSGMGYLMPINTNYESDSGGTTSTNKTFLTNKTYMDNYTKLTETYMQRSGLRVLTIWDDANTAMKSSYEQNTRYLYGATIQAFGSGNVNAVTVNNRLHFMKHTTHYESTYANLKSAITNAVRNAPSQPMFFTYQVNGWEINTQQILTLYNELKATYGNNFEFVRADHLFSYYYEAKKFPYNLCMSASTTSTSSNSAGGNAKLTDGTPVSVWQSQSTTSATARYVQFDFGKTYTINRYVMRFAEDGGLDKKYNLKEWKVEVSTNGSTWILVDHYKNNSKAVADIDINTIDARYVRITAVNSGSDSIARIADVEIYGKVK